jgi:uncharacterized membrane protein
LGSRDHGERASLLIMLGLLFGVSGLTAAIGLLWPGSGLDGMRAGRIGLAAVFLFTGIGHFVKAREMSEMLPASVPARVPIIYASGLLEVAFAAGLIVAGGARAAGLAIIAFLILVFPANVSSAVRRVDFGGHGRGLAYLWARAPLQLLLIGWAYWFAVR